MSVRKNGSLIIRRQLLAMLLVIALCASVAMAAYGSGAAKSPEVINPMPITEETTTLTYFRPVNGYEVTRMSTLDDKRNYQELEKITNIKIDWVSPPEGAGVEWLTLQLSTGDIPDIIGDWIFQLPGGIPKAIEDDLVLPLNDYLDDYAPYYQRLRTMIPDVGKQTMYDSGVVPGFYQIQVDTESPWAGVMIRKDMLDKVGLGVPETMEDWYEALTALKNNGIEIPIQMDPELIAYGGFFLGAYGIGWEYYQDDGVVKYGNIQPEFKDFIAELHKWYAEGLLDPDFDTRDWDSRTELILNDRAAAFFNWNWQVFGKAINETGKGEIVSVPFPTLRDGGPVKFSQKMYNVNPGVCAVITTSCENPEVAIRWMDYMYSEDGFLLMNYGVEGESYVFEDGLPDEMMFKEPAAWAPFLPKLFSEGKHPVFTEAMLKDPDFEFYMASSPWKDQYGPYLRTDRGNEREMDFFAFARYDLWTRPSTEQNLPNISFTTDESGRISEIKTDIDTYRKEMYFAFIKGTESLDNWDNYVATMKSMGIDEMVAIYQAALDRYNAR